ncbi:MAG: hypothetical protein ACYC3T_14790, partial [Candidatus Humimicrobiaceae bacterium]
KQIKIYVFKDPMKNELEVVTEITPLEMSITAASTNLYPEPVDLTVVSDNIGAKDRIVVLQWSSPPNPPYDIDYYNIYRSDGVIKTNNTPVLYSDTNFHNNDKKQYTYFVKAVYSDGTLSQSSNEAITPPD